MPEDKRGEQELGVQGKKLLYATWRLEKMAEDHGADGLRITEIRIRVPREAGEDYLVVVKAVTEIGKRYVGFHGATSISEGLRGATERINNAQMKWKEDNGFGAG